MYIYIFLDVDIDSSGNSFETKTYKKDTNTGSYLNAISECPHRYKEGTIHCLILRTFKIASNYDIFHSDIVKLKQTLINNGYSNTDFDKILNRFLDKRFGNSDNQQNLGTIHNVFYRNQMNQNYLLDEKVLKNIVKNNVKCHKEEDTVKLNIYYKNSKTSNLLIKNSPDLQKGELQRTCVIYEYKCPEGDCELQPSQSYIGVTVTSLSRRLTMHLAAGGTLVHAKNNHKTQLTRKQLVENTKVLFHLKDRNRLEILEAILISKLKPLINRQATGASRILQLFGNVTV